MKENETEKEKKKEKEKEKEKKEAEEEEEEHSQTAAMVKTSYHLYLHRKGLCRNPISSFVTHLDHDPLFTFHLFTPCDGTLQSQICYKCQCKSARFLFTCVALESQLSMTSLLLLWPLTSPHQWPESCKAIRCRSFSSRKHAVTFAGQFYMTLQLAIPYKSWQEWTLISLAWASTSSVYKWVAKSAKLILSISSDSSDCIDHSLVNISKSLSIASSTLTNQVKTRSLLGAHPVDNRNDAEEEKDDRAGDCRRRPLASDRMRRCKAFILWPRQGLHLPFRDSQTKFVCKHRCFVLIDQCKRRAPRLSLAARIL